MRQKVSVIGLGYVGLGIALAASRNYQVIGFDVDNKKIDSLLSGVSYIEGIAEQTLKKSIAEQSFFPTSDPTFLKDSSIVVICVPTPLDDKNEPDTSFLVRAADLIASNLFSSALIVNESTSYPGTLRNVIADRIFDKSRIKHEYASAPERVDPGNTYWNLENTPRLLSGLSTNAIAKAKEFYSTFANEIEVVDSPEIAETAKLFENTFRQVNIALVNELTAICNSLEIDVYKVIDAANTKPYGFMKFTPGPGVGGHCIPIDPTYLAYIAEKNGVKANFIDLANKVNNNMPRYVVQRATQIAGEVIGKSVLVVGVSYKSNISDVRESPAEHIIDELEELGANVHWYDPIVDEWKPNKIYELDNLKFDLVIIQVLHGGMDLEKIRIASPLILDCTGTLKDVHFL